MSMLAEPKQRKRYNLVPRGKALYEDDNRFGTKMLEKMGWKKGNGLGAKEDGSKDFVRVRYKNDALGLGFEERDDQWTQHEQDFTGLLKVLNNEGGSSKVEDNSIRSDNEAQPRVGFGFHETSNMNQSNLKPEKMKEKISGISLEERSRQSKARVHYKKFTKGKDLAQYSEKDLANIFGKKAIEVQDATNDLYQNLNNIFGKDIQSSTGVQMINTGVSVDDYFKTKPVSVRNQTNNIVVENNIEDTTSNDIQSEKSTGKKIKKRKKQDIEEDKGNEQECTSQIIYSNISTTEYFKTKMEALKNKKNNISNKEETVNNVLSNDELLNGGGASKRKRSKKEIKNEVNNCSHIHAMSKKSKKDKYPDQKIVESNGIENEEVLIKKELTSAILDEQENAEFCSSGKKRKKDKSKNKKQIVVEAAEELMTNTENITTAETGINKSCKDDKEVTSDSESRASGAEKRNKNKLKRNNELSVAPNNTDDLCISNLVNENNDLDESAEKKKSKFKNKTTVGSSQIETSHELEITQEPAKKKKNKDKKKTKIIKPVADDNDILSNSECQEVKASNEAMGPPVDTSAGEKSKKKKKIVFKNEFSDLKNCHLDDAKTGGCAIESSEDIILTEGPKKKKSKNKKTPERAQTDDCDKNVDVNFENQTLVAEENTPKNDIEISGTTNYTEELNISHQFQEKALKGIENVSSTAKNILISDVNFGMLDIEEIKRQYNSYNIYPISSFCAEKFRNINLESFVGSSLSELEGYGLSKDVQIKVRFSKQDDERITDLWKFAFNKFEQTKTSKNTYRDYVKEVRTAQRKKRKIPKLNIKTMKRRNMFSSSII